MKNLAEKMIKEIKNNKIVMDFLTNEALEKVASEINAKCYSCITAKGLDLLRQNRRYSNINERVEQYIQAGIGGAVFAKMGLC